MRVMNTSKSSVSIMMAGTASGQLLPPYVVYKAKNVYDTWCEGGPLGTRYNRSDNGWFETASFEDWFETIVKPYAGRCTGTKVIIGDNLSSHLSPNIIKWCDDNDMRFVFLPANTTHLLQPLDVSFFAPMKRKWRENLAEWKMLRSGKAVTIPKDQFPRELNNLMESIKDTASENLKSGFRKTGIVPLNAAVPLAEFPNDSNNDSESVEQPEALQSPANVLVEFLKQKRFSKCISKQERHPQEKD